MGDCKYCYKDYQKSERTILENQLFFANFDKHPVFPGHLKLIPKRHVDSLDELTDEESIALIDLLRKAKELIDEKFHPAGYNYGVNEGEAAGQTVFHLHFHVIPRYEGDMKDPTGGIRNINPKRGNYLNS